MTAPGHIVRQTPKKERYLHAVVVVDADNTPKYHLLAKTLVWKHFRL
jgi:hypothetical protein